MPKLSTEVVQEIISILRSEQCKNCAEISAIINQKFGLKTTRRIISDINSGKSHHDDMIDYPISKRYARNFLTKCCICGEKAVISKDNKEYCRKHYMQLYHHNEILEHTIYEPNEYVDCGDYIEIILKNQFFEEIARTKIDKEDMERVLQYKWYCCQYDNVKQYCQGTLENGKKQRLHHFILQVNDLHKVGLVVDHINGDSLDNRKSNLRIVSQQDNMHNLKPNDEMKGIRVYSLVSGKLRYSARITVNYKQINLGTFDSLQEAQQARKEAEEKYFRSSK